MGWNGRLGTLSAALTAFSIVVMTLTPFTWAQSNYKTLYKFSGGVDGNTPAA
jgi:hypothetical protein